MIDHVNSEYPKEIVELTDAELDAVAAGALVKVTVENVLSHSVNNNNISIPVAVLSSHSNIFQQVQPPM
jgi:hypothetical protein